MPNSKISRLLCNLYIIHTGMVKETNLDTGARKGYSIPATFSVGRLRVFHRDRKNFPTPAKSS